MCYNRACSWTIPDGPGRVGGNAFAIFRESKFKYARGWILCRRLKWERSAVSSRVVLLLRSAEAKLLFYRFVQLCWTLLFLSLSSSLSRLFRVSFDVNILRGGLSCLVSVLVVVGFRDLCVSEEWVNEGFRSFEASFWKAWVNFQKLETFKSLSKTCSDLSLRLKKLRFWLG